MKMDRYKINDLTCPVEPVTFKLFTIVAVKDLVDTDDVARLVGERPSTSGLERWSGDSGRFFVDVDQMIAEIAQVLRFKAFE